MELHQTTTTALAERVEASRVNAEVSIAELSTLAGIDADMLTAKLAGDEEFTIPELATISTHVGARFSDWLTNLGQVAA